MDRVARKCNMLGVKRPWMMITACLWGMQALASAYAATAPATAAAAALAHETTQARAAWPHRQLLQAAGCPACAAELGACAADSSCLEYLMCVIPCGQDVVCSNPCLYRYAALPLVQAFNACSLDNYCGGFSKVTCSCPAPQRSASEIWKQVPLNTLRGTYDIVYGLNPAYDCVGGRSQQYTFSLTPSVVKGRAFNTTFKIFLDDYNISTTVDIRVSAMDAATGAWVTHYVLGGFRGSDMWFVLDSVQDGRYWYVMVVYCADLDVMCDHGGFVLSKRLAPWQRKPVPAKVLGRFAATINQTRWAAASIPSLSDWCVIKPH